MNSQDHGEANHAPLASGTAAPAPGRSSCANPLANSPRAERILVVRLGALGDVLRTLPAVASLRRAYPKARLVWLVEEACADAVRGQAGVDEVLVFRRPELVAALRHGRVLAAARVLRETRRSLRGFDLVLDFHSILRSGVLARLSGAPLRVAYDRPVAREGAQRFANSRVRLEPGRISRFARNAALVDYLGVSSQPQIFRWQIPQTSRDRVAAGIAERLPAGDDFVALHPGTSDSTPYKRWNPERYARLAVSLWQRRGLRSLVTHGSSPAERALGGDVVARADGAAILAPDTGDLSDLAALFELSRAFVGSDSGPLHLASLVGTPVVQLLGPTHPIENEPYDRSPWERVHVPVACSPCRRGCAAAHCMTAIEFESVLGSLLRLVAPPVARSAVAMGPLAAR